MFTILIAVGDSQSGVFAGALYLPLIIVSFVLLFPVCSLVCAWLLTTAVSLSAYV